MHVASRVSKLSPKRPDRSLDPTTQKNAAIAPRVKRSGPEPCFSRPCSTEFKNQWSYASTPKHSFMYCTGTTIYCTLLVLLSNKYKHNVLVCYLNCARTQRTRYAENITLDFDILGYCRGDVEAFVLPGC